MRAFGVDVFADTGDTGVFYRAVSSVDCTACLASEAWGGWRWKEHTVEEGVVEEVDGAGACEDQPHASECCFGVASWPSTCAAESVLPSVYGLL